MFKDLLSIIPKPCPWDSLASCFWLKSKLGKQRDNSRPSIPIELSYRKGRDSALPKSAQRLCGSVSSLTIGFQTLYFLVRRKGGHNPKRFKFQEIQNSVELPVSVLIAYDDPQERHYLEEVADDCRLIAY